MPELQIKICEKCKKDCMPVPTPQTGIHHSEWYCKPCHQSYPMDKDTAMYFAQRMK